MRKVFLRALDDLQDEKEGERKNAERYKRELPANGEHHDEDTEEGGGGGDDLRDALVERLAQGIDIIGYAGEHFAVGDAVKIAEGHTVNLLHNIVAQVISDFHRDAGHDPALPIGEKQARQIQNQQRQQNVRNRAEIDAGARTGDLAHNAVEELCGRIAEHLWTHDSKDGGGNGKEHHKEQAEFIAAEIVKQLLHCALEIFHFRFAMRCGGWAVSHSNSSFDNWDCAISR